MSRPRADDRPIGRRLGIRGRFTAAITATVALSVLALVMIVGALGAKMLRDGHDVSLQRESTRVASLVGVDAAYVASGSCEYAAEPACTAIIGRTTHVGDSVLGITITAEQLALVHGQGNRTAVWSNARARTAHGRVQLRVLSTALPDGRALVTASPTTTVDRSVQRLHLLLAVAGAATVLGAAVISAFVAGRTVRPILRLTDATERIVSTGDPTGRVGLPRADELGRLSTAIDDMLARLDRAEAARRNLIEDASHDLRSPLTALTTNLELLARADLPAELRTRLIADAGHGATDMTRLVDDITSLAGTDGARQTQREYAPADVASEALSAAARRWHRTAFTSGGHPSTTIRAVGDPELLVRAILNLLDNAAKYGPTGGTVRLDTGADQDAWWVRVSDDGPGIPPEALPRVFDRAYRADGALRHPGSGIGLAMAKQTAERHGGTVTVAEDSATGTTMLLRIPWTPPPDASGAFPG